MSLVLEVLLSRYSFSVGNPPQQLFRGLQQLLLQWHCKDVLIIWTHLSLVLIQGLNLVCGTNGSLKGPMIGILFVDKIIPRGPCLVNLVPQECNKLRVPLFQLGGGVLRV